MTWQTDRTVHKVLPGNILTLSSSIEESIEGILCGEKKSMCSTSKAFSTFRTVDLKTTLHDVFTHLSVFITHT